RLPHRLVYAPIPAEVGLRLPSGGRRCDACTRSTDMCASTAADGCMDRESPPPRYRLCGSKELRPPHLPQLCRCASSVALDVPVQRIAFYPQSLEAFKLQNILASATGG